MYWPQLQNKLYLAARRNPPSAEVPYLFESRVMARLAAAPAREDWAAWARALWYGAGICTMVALLIGLWVWDELSFNTYHQNYNRVAQVMKLATYDGEKEAVQYLSYPLTIQLKNNYKNYFKHLVTARAEEDFDLAAGEKKITQTGQFIDAGAPEMLSLKMLKGSRSALQELHSILLSASAAKILFGNKDPMGKPVIINNNINVKVTGVYKDLPLNSTFHHVQFFSPFDLDIASNSWIKEQGWDNQFLIMYAEIMPGYDFKTISSAIKDAELGIIKNLNQYKKQADRKPQVFLNPMSQWHLYSQFKGGIRESGPVQFVWLIGIIGAFVLLLACINFMNLSTPRSEKRAREVGVRKTLG
jgi:hypothetical protein